MSIASKIECMINWLRERVDEAGAKGLVVGVSGGIDSAVVAALIKKAYPDNSVGIIIPIKSNPKDVVDAEELLNKIGLKHLIADITNEQDSILNNVQSSLEGIGIWQESYKRLTDANLRARLRMSTIYTVANNLGYLVVGTDNAAEVLTGYFTKYGDGGVDILPLANLLKSEVYMWAKELGVPQAILDKAPSAGLWEGQTDEVEMGTTYEYIDLYLKGEVIPEKDKLIIETLNKKSEHKRVMPPAAPKF